MCHATRHICIKAWVHCYSFAFRQQQTADCSRLVALHGQGSIADWLGARQIIVSNCHDQCLLACWGQLCLTCPAGDSGMEAEPTAVEAIVQHYQAVQQSNAVLQPSNTASKGCRTDSRDQKYYSNGTPAERYWSTMGSENNSKRQNVSSLLQTIFPDGLAPLANKVAKIERKEQAKAAKQAAKQAAAMAAVSCVPAEAAAADSSADFVTDHATGIVIRKSSSVAVGIAIGPGLNKADVSAMMAADRRTASLNKAGQPQTSSVLQGEDVRVFEAQARTSGLASTSSSAHVQRRTSDAASAIFRDDVKPQQKHYSHGQKLAATILWEAASSKSQPVRLRQCLTYSEIRMKNLAEAELAQSPLLHLELQESARRLAQEV